MVLSRGSIIFSGIVPLRNNKTKTMFKTSQFIGLVILGLLLSAPAWGQQEYRNGQALENSIRALEQQYGELLEVTTLAQTTAGRPIWQLTIGTGEPDVKPAVAIVGGVAGPHLLGQELALGVAENLLAGSAEDSIRQLIDEVTFYVFPQMSPDAAAQYFADLKYERMGNARDTDTDRDGYLNEDPGEDLNGDGMLTRMRVAAPDGEWVAHPADPRILRKAKPGDGTENRYHIFPEGRDNDQDGQQSEDGPGGIFFNKNWTFQHPTFREGAGEYGVSEVETRALADFLYERFNVFAVLTFGPSDNLSSPYEYSSSNDRQRVISGILRSDAAVNKMVSDLYNEHVDVKKGTRSSMSGGGFMEWAYFHYGRFSYGVPGWQVPEWQMPKDSSEAAQYEPNSDKNADLNLLRWAESEGIDNAFADWTPIEHPDYPGQSVEVGGLAPFLAYNPPYGQVRELVDQHADFTLHLTRHRPVVSLSNVRTEQVDDNLWRVKATVVNTGMMPTASQVGNDFNWVKRLRVELELADGQALSTGRPIYLYPAMDSGESRELSWLVRGNGTVTLSAGAPHLGTETITLNLQ